MARRLPQILVVILLALFVGSGVSRAQTKLLRFPDIHGDKVAFCYAGDIWLAPTAGGTATRLTAHPGQELFPKFSPDGRWVAFTGQYDGDEQVYVVPAGGGVPRQLTYYPARGPLAPRWGYDNQVYDWALDGSAVLFRSMRYGHDLTDTKLFLVSVDGGLPRALPMPESGAGDLSPDGRFVVYSPLVRDFRTWKRYEGGWAQELYIFDLETFDIERVTDHPRADRDPMWIGDKIYFSSDRDGTLNLYVFDTGTKQTEQLTQSGTWDVRWPSDDGVGRIVFELNGELQIYGIGEGQLQPISITVPNDGVAMRPSRISAANRIEDFELSPKGERALFVARGDVFTAPIEKGPTRNLTRTSGAHDKWARWSPDGTRIAFISDLDGEDELYIVAQDGSEEPVQLTDGGQAMRYAPEWSPDGKRLAFADKDGRLYVVETDAKPQTLIADERRGQVRDYVWSPNGGHLAFSLSDPSEYRSIYIWSVSDGEAQRVTGELFSEFGPAWGPKGDYLFYLSDRAFAPQVGSIEWNYVVDRETGIFAIALRKDVPHLFPPESDEVTMDEEDGEENDGDAKASKKKKDEDDADEADERELKEYIVIDFESLADRTLRVPVEADNYGGLSATDEYLLFYRSPPFYYGRQPDFKTELKIFSFENREATTLVGDISGYAVSMDGSKVLVEQDAKYKLYDVKAEADDPKVVSTQGLQVDRVPADEWREVFDEVWRRYRDFFYVENMHGYDWKALGEQYRPWLAHVAHRSDLNYVIGEMIAELNVGHAYISGGDYEIPDRPRVALPGARLELDEAAQRYRIVKIFHGQNEEPRYRAPLTEVGVEVDEGDYVLAIDGEELTARINPYRLLRHKADRPVEFSVNAEPTVDGARSVRFNPVSGETSLIYLDKVTSNREKVAAMTDGRVGYLHLPDMGSQGIQEFVKYYYGQIRKEGLVIDVRGNGGGNVSQMVLERLSREILGTRFERTSNWPRTYPYSVFYGHMACILDEDSASDGDIFPYRFRNAGLGPLIGKRSWGGVTGIGYRGPLIDGGDVRVPEVGTNDLEGNWIIEGIGVEPDIEVENDPKSVLEGRDPQLERAVEEVLKQMRDDPRRLPERPAPPVKTK